MSGFPEALVGALRIAELDAGNVKTGIARVGSIAKYRAM
jgi:hypothetical protein